MSQACRLGRFGGLERTPPFTEKGLFLAEKSPCLVKKVHTGLLCIWSISAYNVPCNDLSCMVFTINYVKFCIKFPGTTGEGMAQQRVLYSVQTAHAPWLYSTVYCSNTMLGRKPNVFVRKHLTIYFFMYMYTRVHSILSNYNCFASHVNTDVLLAYIDKRYTKLSEKNPPFANRATGLWARVWLQLWPPKQGTLTLLFIKKPLLDSGH